MLRLYDEDEKIIVAIVDKVREKHLDGSDFTWEKLTRLHRELEGRLEDAGYVVVVDVTPLLEGQPPIVRVDGKQESEYNFDHEKKAQEIKKRERKPKIEGMT